MPATPTPRLGLHRPAGGDDANIPADLDTLTDQLDTHVPHAEGLRSERPAASPSGQLYQSTDGAGVEISTPSAVWIPLRARTLAALPAAPDNADEVYLQADGAQAYGGPHYWHCFYVATTPGAYKWHVLGGQALTVTGVGPMLSPALASVATITAPLSGVYEVSATLTVAVGGINIPAFKQLYGELVVTVPTTPRAWAAMSGDDFTEWAATATLGPRQITMTAGQGVQLRGKVLESNASAQYALSVRPVRLG